MKPIGKFTIPVTQVFTDLDGREMKEPGPDGTTRCITLGLVLGAAVNSETKVEGVTLDVVDRLFLAKKFRDDKCELKVSTCEQVKKLVAKHFENQPLLSGQALMLLGEEPKDL